MMVFKCDRCKKIPSNQVKEGVMKLEVRGDSKETKELCNVCIYSLISWLESCETSEEPVTSNFKS